MEGRHVDTPLGLLIILALLIFVATTVYSAWKRFHPKDIFGVNDKLISRLAFGRSFVGLLTIILSTLSFRGAVRVIADWMLHVVEVLVVGTLSVLICIVFAVLINHKLFNRSILRPLSKMALTFGSLIVGDALGHLRIVTTTLNMKQPTLRAVFVDSIGGWLLLVILWLTLFGLWAALYYAPRYLYSTGEVHPLLGPLVTIVAVTLITAMDIARANGWFGRLETLFANTVGEPNPSFLLHPAPRNVILLLTLCGWLTTVILAVREWQEISTQYRMSLQTIPTPQRATTVGARRDDYGPPIPPPRWRPPKA